MFLATLHVSMDLEPEVPAGDKERVMRSLRDKLRQLYGHRISVRTDEETALFIALFDDSFERAKSRIDDVLEKIEVAGEARIFDHNSQVFAWFDGKFTETREELELDDDANNLSRKDKTEEPRMGDRMIVYSDEEDEGFGPLPTRFGRRGLRLPTRK